MAGESFTVALRVSHLTADALGGPFVDHTEAMEKKMLEILDAEFAAARLQLRPQGELIGEFQGKAQLFASTAGEEILVVENAGKIEKIRLVFLGNVIEGLSDGKLLSGFIDERHRFDENSLRPGQPLIRGMHPIDLPTAKLAGRFVASVEGLDTRTRNHVIQLLRRALSL